MPKTRVKTQASSAKRVTRSTAKALKAKIDRLHENTTRIANEKKKLGGAKTSRAKKPSARVHQSILPSERFTRSAAKNAELNSKQNVPQAVLKRNLKKVTKKNQKRGTVAEKKLEANFRKVDGKGYEVPALNIMQAGANGKTIVYANTPCLTNAQLAQIPVHAVQSGAIGAPTVVTSGAPIMYTGTIGAPTVYDGTSSAPIVYDGTSASFNARIAQTLNTINYSTQLLSTVTHSTQQLYSSTILNLTQLLSATQTIVPTSIGQHGFAQHSNRAGRVTNEEVIQNYCERDPDAGDRNNFEGVCVPLTRDLEGEECPVCLEPLNRDKPLKSTGKLVELYKGVTRSLIRQ